MATKTPGSGGTDQTTTIEAGTIHLIRLIQALEADSTRNPSGINNLTSTVSEDSRTIAATVNLPCNLVSTSDQTTNQVQAIDYLTQPQGQPPAYTPGSGGTFRGTTVQQALIQHVIAQRTLEINPAQNPTGANYIEYQISSVTAGGNGNAVFTATLTGLPLEVANNSNGTQTTSGRAYLL